MTTVDDQLIQTVVLLKRQFLLTEHLLKRGRKALEDFQDAVSAQRQSVEHVLDVLNFAFALIDNLVRYQKIARSIPRINQKSPEFRALISSLGELTDIRNQHQHINRNIMNNFSGPLLGTVSWTDANANYFASFNDVGRQRSVPGMVFDTQENRFVLQFCYIFGDKYHDLQRAIEGMQSFNAYLDKRVVISLDGARFSADEHYMAGCATFILPHES
jgi:hypothetical protein